MKKTTLMQVLLERQQKVLAPTVKGAANLETTAPFLAILYGEMDCLGYVVTEKLHNELVKASTVELTGFAGSLLANLQEMKGIRNYQPLYPNFPAQVEQLDPMELMLNAVIHYGTYGEWLPSYLKEKRESLAQNEKNALEEIDLATEQDSQLLLSQLIQAKEAYSVSTKEDLATLLIELAPKKLDLAHVMNKENLAYLTEILIELGWSVAELKKYYTTATDVLRLAVQLSAGDISLATSTKLKHFNRKERRFFLGLLENCGNVHEDIQRYSDVWLRFGEILHPGEYQARYPKTAKVFKDLRENQLPATYTSKLEKAFISYNLPEIIKLLKQRPGEFARRIDRLMALLTWEQDPKRMDQMLHEFAQVACQVASPVLLNLMAHMRTRNQASSNRVFFPKGQVAKFYATYEVRRPLKEQDCQHLIEICQTALIGQYRQKEYLGKVYVDPVLKNYTIPFAQRSASKALKTIARGSRISLDSKRSKILRAFIYWRGEGVDVDSSLFLFDKNWQSVSFCSYYQLKDGIGSMVHSGDIVTAPNGASEFVDIDLAKAKKAGGRYLLFSINSYSQIPFCNMEECFAGVMLRKNANSGEVFEPRTLQNRFDCSGDQLVSIPLVVDLETMELIWSDLALPHQLRGDYRPNNVHQHLTGLAAVGYAMTHLAKPTMYDLYRLHGQARGTLVSTPAAADLVFDETEKSTVSIHDFDWILSEFI